jgi:uncharacterized membrane protein YkoI
MKTNSLCSHCATLFLSAVIALSSGIGFGSESSDEDQDQATHDALLEYRQSQDILTFEDILKIIRTDIEGEIIEIEFEVEGGVPIYEITFIDAAGQVLEMYMNAKTGVFFEEEPE